MIIIHKNSFVNCITTKVLFTNIDFFEGILNLIKMSARAFDGFSSGRRKMFLNKTRVTLFGLFSHVLMIMNLQLKRYLLQKMLFNQFFFIVFPRMIKIINDNEY